MECKGFIIADGQYLSRLGMSHLLNELNINLVGQASDADELQLLAQSHPEAAIILDFESPGFNSTVLSESYLNNKNILAITVSKRASFVNRALENGILGYILKECSEEETRDAIVAISRGEHFFCRRLLEEAIQGDEEMSEASFITCDPITLSDRETEIIKLITQGLNYKEIAEKLFLSFHTVTTHRKNIMKKLAVRNTAGIVRYALQEQLVSLN